MKADLHIHSNFSRDAVSSPKEIVESALAKGLDCICITDHGEIKGAIEAMKYGFDKNILIIPGIEIFSTSGHILGINVKKIIPNGLSAKNTVQEIKKQGGIAIIPHPFNWPLGYFWGGQEELRTIGADCLEAFNASVLRGSANEKALNFSQKNAFLLSAGSDAHRAEFVGRGYVEIPENFLSEKDALEKLFNKNSKALGSRLSIRELLRNGSNVKIQDEIKYIAFRMRARRLRQQIKEG